MALNPFFLQGSQSEQRLIQELINEQLTIYGVEVIYLPRKIVNQDTVLNEIQSSKFDDNFAIEAYVNTYEGYGGAGDIMTKFGMSLKDELTVTISKERFEDFIAPYLEEFDEDEINVSTRPREGDLIYFPLGGRLFEVKFVEHEQPFYQLGKNYVYQLKCELFEYSDELGGWNQLSTTTEEIDDVLETQGYITSLVMIGSGTTAQVTPVTGTGYVRKIFLNDDGSGYTSTPTISFTDSPNGYSISNASAVAITTVSSNVHSVKEILLTNAGFGYTEAPTITISGGGGSGAIATCSIETEETGIVRFSIENAGTGYPIPPAITVGAPTGPGGAATAIISGIGTLTSTTITAGGEYYDPLNPPDVTFSNPGGGGNETNIVKFGSRSYNGGNSGNLIPTTGISTSDVGAVEFWFYFTQLPGDGDTFTIAKWGSNDGDNEHYRLNIQSLNGEAQLFYVRPTSDFESGTSTTAVSTTAHNDLNRWNWIRISQTDSGANRVATHYMGSSGTFQSSFSSSTFNAQIYNGNGFNINPDGHFSDNQIFVDEVRFTTDGSITQPTLPTSTSANLPNTVAFGGGERVTAQGSAVVGSSGSITSITITNVGAGYSSAPTISIANTAANKVFESSGLTTAIAKANVSTDNRLSSINIINPGSGYNQLQPVVTVASPPTTGIGTFTFNELVTGSISGAQGRVKTWDSTTNTLKLGTTNGTFVPGDIIVGSASSAKYSVDFIESAEFADKYDKGDEIETEADTLLDFTETNPFGTY